MGMDVSWHVHEDTKVDCRRLTDCVTFTDGDDAVSSQKPQGE